MYQEYGIGFETLALDRKGSHWTKGNSIENLWAEKVKFTFEKMDRFTFNWVLHEILFTFVVILQSINEVSLRRKERI